MSWWNLPALWKKGTARRPIDTVVKLPDRDLADLGLDRATVDDRPMHAPVDVGNDRV